MDRHAGVERHSCDGARFSAFVIRHSAFTLIEIMLAIAILAVICGTIYQFTATTVRATVVSAQADSREVSFSGLRRLLDAQFAALPFSEPHAFLGATTDGKHGKRDALQMICPAGNALLTPDAHGLYQITLGLHEIPRGSGHYVLGLEREPWTDDSETLLNGADAFQLPAVSAGGVRTTGTSLQSEQGPSDWVRLLDGVSALEISYFDPRLNTWLDKWSDQTFIPSLVRVRLTMENSDVPYEFVEQVPGGGLRRGLPSSVASSNGIPGLPPGITVPSLPPGITAPTFPAGLSSGASNSKPPGTAPGNAPSGPVLFPDTGSGLPPH